MKCSNNGGFEQAYNGQVAVDQATLLIVAHALSNHPNDKAEAEPTLAALPAALGTPAAVAMDNGYFSANNIAACETLGIEPYIATGREPHHQSWQERFAAEPEPPPADASPQVQMAYKLQTAIGKEIYRLRKAPWNPSSASSRRCSAFASFRYAASMPSMRMGPRLPRLQPEASAYAKLGLTAPNAGRVRRNEAPPVSIWRVKEHFRYLPAGVQHYQLLASALWAHQTGCEMVTIVSLRQAARGRLCSSCTERTKAGLHALHL